MIKFILLNLNIFLHTTTKLSSTKVLIWKNMKLVTALNVGFIGDCVGVAYTTHIFIYLRYLQKRYSTEQVSDPTPSILMSILMKH